MRISASLPRAASTAALATVLAATASPALPAAPLDHGSGKVPEFGVQFHGTWSDYTDPERIRVLDALRTHGASAVRIDVSWRMLQPDGPGRFSEWGMALVDKAIGLAVERGMAPLVTLWMAPQWANGSADERVPPTSDVGLAGLERVARDLAAKYRGSVLAWEVWNEPNSDDFMRGASPETYARLLRAANAGFKAGDAAATVVFGGPMYIDAEWVDRVLRAGGAGNYDVMGVHPYSAVGDEAPDLPDNGTPWRMRHLPALRSVMAAHGDGAKPVWFTEFGWRVRPTPPDARNWERGVSPDTAAEYLARTFRLVAEEWPYVERVFWYKDRSDSADPARAGYGLVLPDGSAMPALAKAGQLGGSGTLLRTRTTQVEVKAVRGRSKLRIDVDPNLARGNVRFRVQRLGKAGTWVTLKRKYRTKGRAEKRTLNLRRGTYRVVVPAQRDLSGAMSAPIWLRR